VRSKGRFVVARGVCASIADFQNPSIGRRSTSIHIVAQQHDGPTVSENLAVSCSHCNLHKGPNLTGLDPDDRKIARLFNPRQDLWHEHFAWDGPLVIGLTSTGRATVVVLNMNSGIRVRLRVELISAGLFPLSEPTENSS
jgi:hypothetical protein